MTTLTTWFFLSKSFQLWQKTTFVTSYPTWAEFKKTFIQHPVLPCELPQNIIPPDILHVFYKHPHWHWHHHLNGQVCSLQQWILPSIAFSPFEVGIWRLARRGSVFLRSSLVAHQTSSSFHKIVRFVPHHYWFGRTNFTNSTSRL